MSRSRIEPNVVRQQRQEARQLLRQLPEAIRLQLTRVRRPDLRQRIAQEVLEYATGIARSRGAVRLSKATNPFEEDREWIAPVAKRRIMRALANNREYIQQVHRRVDEALRVAHLERISPETPDVSHFEEPSPVGRTGGPRAFESDLGLRTATAIDEAPDEFFVDAVRAILRATGAEDVWLGALAPKLKVLALDPRGGALARAVVAMEGEAQVAVQEVGPEFTSTSFSSVLSGRDRNIKPASFDAVVWSVPAPAYSSAANHVQVYRQSPGDDLRQLNYKVGGQYVSRRSPSTLGPARWQKAVGAILKDVVRAALKPGGLAILRIPGGMRIAEKPRRGRPARNGYEVVPGLDEALIAAADSWGFDVLGVEMAMDNEAVRQPFVSSQRLPWTHATLRRKAG